MTLPSQDSAIERELSASAPASAPANRSEIETVVIHLFDHLQERVLNYVLTFGVSFHDAEDVVQETFLSLFRHLVLDRPRSNLNGWLFRVAHNLALKRRSSNRVVESRLDHAGILALQADPAPDPEGRLAFSQMHQRLRAVLDALPEQEQRCLYLRAEGLKYRKIARVLGVSLSTVSTSLTWALARMMRASGTE